MASDGRHVDVNPGDPGAQRLEVDGAPACISASTLAAVLARVVDEPVDGVSHERLSSHRESKLGSPVVRRFREELAQRAVFRVRVTTVSGRARDLIVKNDPTPQGMSDFEQWWWFGSVRRDADPPAEARVYQAPGDALAPMLPKVHASIEIVPGGHYQYFLEDLAGHEPARGRAAVSRVAGLIPRLHAALRVTAAGRPAELSRCDLLYDTLTAAIDRYAAESPEPVVARVRDLWHRLLDLAGSPDYAAIGELSPIHGDLSSPNVFVRPDQPGGMRVIDWESMVLGRPHTDLVHLLMHEGPVAESQALEAYAASEPSRSLAEHWRLYRWCRLEYCYTKAITILLEARASGESPRIRHVDVDRAISEAAFYTHLLAGRPPQDTRRWVAVPIEGPAAVSGASRTTSAGEA